MRGNPNHSLKSYEKLSMRRSLRDNKLPKQCSIKYVIIISIVIAVIIGIGIIIGVTSNNDNNNQESSDIYYSDDWLVNEIINLPNNDSCYQYSLMFADKPHVAGMKETIEVGYTVGNEWEKLGFKPIYDNISNIVLSKYISSNLSWVINDELIPIDLSNDIIDTDSSTSDPFRSRAWFAFGATGNVTAPMLYVGNGTNDDYQFLMDLGYNLTQYIGIAKVRSRGTQARTAGEHGLKGLILFRDPGPSPPQHDMPYGSDNQYPNDRYLPDGGFMYGTVRIGSGCSGSVNEERLVEQCDFDNSTDNWDKLFPSIYYDLPMVAMSSKTGMNIY